MMPRYAAIYFSILYIRYRAGIVTDEMIALPKSRFMAIGILEALGVASGMASAGIIFIQLIRFSIIFIKSIFLKRKQFSFALLTMPKLFSLCLIGPLY